MGEAMQRYFAEKNVARRSALLRELVFACRPEGKDFFRRAFQKERYLDLKLTAVRGYAFYASEDEVVPLMEKLLALLQKRPERTPYDYQEYEVMRSQYLMPYLLEKYSYPCFRAFNAQLEAQYAALPEVFKHIFTCDERGNIQQLRDKKEVQAALAKFFAGED